MLTPAVIHGIIHMPENLILASGSEIRAKLLQNAGVQISLQPARIDEEAVRAALEEEDAPPRDVADTLAEMKALKISDKNPSALVLGCDQVLAIGREVLGKPETIEEVRAQLKKLRGQQHNLLSAAVIVKDGKPIWRHVGQARLKMRNFNDAYLDAYLDRNWQSVRHSVGGYKLEEEGVRLFNHVQGDYFTILGLPLIELLSYLTTIGELEE